MSTGDILWSFGLAVLFLVVVWGQLASVRAIEQAKKGPGDAAARAAMAEELRAMRACRKDLTMLRDRRRARASERPDALSRVLSGLSLGVSPMDGWSMEVRWSDPLAEPSSAPARAPDAPAPPPTSFAEEDAVAVAYGMVGLSSSSTDEQVRAREWELLVRHRPSARAEGVERTCALRDFRRYVQAFAVIKKARGLRATKGD